MAVELITQAEYARRRGCSRVAVTKAIDKGRISLIDGMIDPAVADVQWKANTRARAGSASMRETRQAKDDGGEEGYMAARTRREQAEAELAELKLAEARGDLVRAAEVRSALAKRAAALREGLLQLPARLTPVLAAETDPARVHEMLDVEIRAAMAHLTAEA